MRMETDVNYLLHRQQISLLQAQGARSVESRRAYEIMARNYSDRVAAYAHENRLAAFSSH